MSIDLPEKRLLFRFAPGTRTQRWDGSDAYRQGLSQQAGTKAADLCWWAGDAGGLLEVTNYGPHRRPRIEDLAREAGQKFRDSLSGMIWTCKRDLAPRPKAEFVRRFIDPSRGEKLVLALWFEADRPADQEEAGFLEEAIRDFVRPWLFARIVVTNRQLFGSHRSRLPGLEEVVSLA